MPSSISNSEERIPPGPWLKTWITAGFLVFSVMLPLAWFVHAQNPEPPRFSDNFESWSRLRHRASDAGERGVIFIGTSRVLAGIRVDVVNRRWPSCVPLQLAINGTSPLPILDDLAADPKIRGLVVVEYCPSMLFRLDTDPELFSRKWVEQFHHSAAAAFEEHEPTHREQAGWLAVIQNRKYSWNRVFQYVPGMRAVDSGVRYSVNKNRELLMDFSSADMGRLRSADNIRKTFAVHVEDPLQIKSRFFDRISKDIAMIRSHGGQVVFAYFPFGFSVRDEEARQFPRSVYWENLLKEFDGIGIHYLDEPTLSRFDCPDFGHLDQVDATAFSEAFLDIMSAKLRTAGDNRSDHWR